MGRLAGRTALVTGASRGIGRAIAIDFGREGAQVAINYLSNRAQAEEVAERIREVGGPEPILSQADVTVPSDVRRMVDETISAFGHLDILVNNAGKTRDKTLRRLSDEDWLDVINTNLHSVYHCVKAVMEHMISRNYGRIINISSFVGQSGNFGQSNYAASKGGIIAFTKTAALELARYNITVNALAPGFTTTDMLALVPDAVQQQIKQRIPLGRFGRPDEVAKAVTFWAAEGDYITGQQINVNGGVYM
ncbi:MAG: 3-oxoacyl-ACP reductase FabG [Dehalococcoidia bacterium]|nr:3-oxoacyl-ACP reductase FabG [Dehalococcoidia bacterium]